MNADEIITPEKLDLLKGLAKQGSVEAMLKLTDDLVPHYANNLAEIERRKQNC